jgi:heme oxygenase (mycobilin-producing)
MLHVAITSILELTIKPESVEDAARVIDEVLVATRAFAGNLGVDVVVDVADPAHYLLIEHWESLEADDAYRAFRATPEGRSDLGAILAAPPQMARYTGA